MNTIQWGGGAKARRELGAKYDGDVNVIGAETDDFCLYGEGLENGMWRWSLVGFADSEEAAKQQMETLVRRASIRVI